MTPKKTPANSGKISGKKAMPEGKRFVKGKSGNPAGRPKDGESWAKIIKEVGDMYPADILAFVGETGPLAAQIKQLPPNVQMKYLVTARVYAALMFDPTAGLWNGLMDRAEGKVPDKLQVEGNLNVDGLDNSLDKIYGNGYDQS